MKKITFLICLLFASVANANMITVDYEVNNGAGFWGDGSFSGTDIDANGFLSFEEIISFSGSNNIENQTVDLSTLVDVGDFDISNNTWLNNAIAWTINPDNAWFTWNSRTNSVNSSWASVTASATINSVPEPSSIALLGLAALVLFRKRKAA